MGDRPNGSDGEKPKRKRTLGRRLLRWAVLSVLALVAVIGGADLWVRAISNDYLFDDVDDIPAAPVAVVLGCSPMTVEGRPNAFFETRMDRAAALWQSGKVGAIIISGDNSEKYYNEPQAMRSALIERGVPHERLVSDYAGFRTLDSMVRADRVFGQSELIVVSQEFHNQRAIAIARHHGINAVGLNANDVGGRGGLKVGLRERLARVKLLLDLFVFDTQPRFLGDPVNVPVD